MIYSQHSSLANINIYEFATDFQSKLPLLDDVMDAAGGSINFSFPPSILSSATILQKAQFEKTLYSSCHARSVLPTNIREQVSNDMAWATTKILPEVVFCKIAFIVL